jgi:tetrahydromethanopterin S-methyltransferase subunit G
MMLITADRKSQKRWSTKASQKDEEIRQLNKRLAILERALKWYAGETYQRASRAVLDDFSLVARRALERARKVK